MTHAPLFRKALSLPFDFAIGVHFDHMLRWWIHDPYYVEIYSIGEQIKFDQGGVQKDNQR